MAAPDERVHGFFDLFFIRGCPLPAAGKKAVDCIVHFRDSIERVCPVFLRDPLFIQDVFDACSAIALAGGAGGKLTCSLPVVKQMQLLEPADSFLRVPLFLALLDEPLLQLLFRYACRGDNAHGPRFCGRLSGGSQQRLIVAL